MAALERQSRLFGNLRVEVSMRHLHITARPLLGPERRFSVDVACLAPQFPVEYPQARRWLIAAVSTAVGATFTAYLAAWGFLPVASTMAALCLLLTAAVCAVVYAVRGAPALLLATRHAHLPLLRIAPYRKDDRELNSFLEILKIRIRESTAQRHLDGERLRSGEIRTLRRLCNESVISETEYQQARQAALRSPTMA